MNLRARLWPWSVLAVVALLSFPALAQNPQERPFKTTAVGQITYAVPGPGEVDLIAAGSSKATHLGNSQWLFPHTLFVPSFTV